MTAVDETVSTEVIRPATVVNPSTGEALTLDAPTEDLARWLADVRDAEAVIRDAKRLVNREVISRMDKTASWTVHLPGVKVSAPSPKPTEQFDGPALRDALLDLVDEGVLTIEAVDAAVETVVTYEPRKRGLNALRALGGRVAEVVAAHCVTVDKDRYVRVERP